MPALTLSRLVHGPCEPEFLTALHTALTTSGPPSRPLHRLQALAAQLPSARRPLDEPDRLITLHAWSAVTDPAHCMTSLVHYFLCLGSITSLCDDPEPLEAEIAGLERGRTKGLYLITEVGESNSHLAPRTLARFDAAAGDFVLDSPDAGAAKFCAAGDGGVPQTAVVLARLSAGGTDHGAFGFVVPLTDARGPLPGVEISSPIVLSALPLTYTLVRFRGVRVPCTHWLSDGARITAEGACADRLAPAGGEIRLQRTLRAGLGLWAAVPAVAAALCRQSAVLAVTFALTRTTQGRLAPGAPLLGHRVQQRAVLGALADAFALTRAAGAAQRVWQEGRTGPADSVGCSPWASVGGPLAAYKAITVRTAAQTVDRCRGHCGLPGHLDMNRLAGYHGFLRSFETAGGDSRLMFYDIGQALAGKAWEDDPPPDDTESRPTDPGWWPALARRHEHALAVRLRRRLGRPAPDAFSLWNPLLEDAGHLGEAHAVRLVAEDTARAVAGLRPEEPAEAVAALAALHGITAARRHLGSLLATGVLTPGDAEQLPYAMDTLCDAVLPRLPLLVEAFGYPDDLVGSGLGTGTADAGLTWTTGGGAG